MHFINILLVYFPCSQLDRTLFPLMLVVVAVFFFVHRRPAVCNVIYDFMTGVYSGV